LSVVPFGVKNSFIVAEGPDKIVFLSKDRLCFWLPGIYMLADCPDRLVMHLMPTKSFGSSSVDNFRPEGSQKRHHTTGTPYGHGVIG